jgi:hypothetical protein
MRSINYTIKGAMLAGVLVLSTSPALAFGANKAANEEPKVEINKVEINKVEKTKVEKAMLQEKKVEEMKANSHSSVLLGEGILDEEGIILGEEDILGEGLLGIGE